MVKYANYLINIVMIDNGNIRNKSKIAEKLKGCTYNTTQILAFNYPRAATLVPYKQHYLGFDVLPNLKTRDMSTFVGISPQFSCIFYLISRVFTDFNEKFNLMF